MIDLKVLLCRSQRHSRGLKEVQTRHGQPFIKYQITSEAIFLVMRGTSSFPLRHEVFSCFPMYLFPNLERALTYQDYVNIRPLDLTNC